MKNRIHFGTLNAGVRGLSRGEMRDVRGGGLFGSIIGAVVGAGGAVGCQFFKKKNHRLICTTATGVVSSVLPFLPF